MSHTPLYVLIKNYIIENIKSEKLTPGDKVPSEKELSELFNVSRITVSTAIRDLVKDGIVYRIQGKGTFIADKKEENMQYHSSFGFEHNDKSYINKGIHLTKCVEEIKADNKLAAKLDIKEGQSIYKITRTKVINNIVYAVEYVYLPANLYPSFNISTVQNSLIHNIVDEFCFLKRKREKVYIKPLSINEKDAKELNIPCGIPVIIWEHLTFTSENIIVEYSENIINTTIHNFYLEFESN